MYIVLCIFHHLKELHKFISYFSSTLMIKGVIFVYLLFINHISYTIFLSFTGGRRKRQEMVTYHKHTLLTYHPRIKCLSLVLRRVNGKALLRKITFELLEK